MKDKTNGMIAELLPMADAEELREFVQQHAGDDVSFAVKLSQWLMKRYGPYVNKTSVYVQEVRRLFGLTEEKYRGYNRSRYYDGCGLDWIALEEGMVQLVAALREKLQAGMPDVVAAPVVEFYRLLKDHLEEFFEEDEANIDQAGRACDALLLEWAEHPDVPVQEKRDLYDTLQVLARAEIMDYVDSLTDAFFMNYLTRTQSPEEALHTIEKLTAEGKVCEELVHKHIALLRQFGREPEALEVIRRNLRYLSVLDAELERLYTRQDDCAALSLLDLAALRHQGNAGIDERRIRFLLRLNDTQKLIEVYRHLLLNQWNGFDYYPKLKALVSPSEWPEQYKQIVKEGKKRSNEFMARIYAAENDYPMLYQSIMSVRYGVLQMLQQYMVMLPEEYHEKLLQKGYTSIDIEANRAEKRSDYACVVSKIRQFSALPGAKPLADEMVTNLRTIYSRRPAYMDELSKL